MHSYDIEAADNLADLADDDDDDSDEDSGASGSKRTSFEHANGGVPAKSGKGELLVGGKNFDRERR